MERMNPIVSARGLAKRFGKTTVLEGFDCQLASGRVTVLLGENGAGKSTLLRMMLGLLRPDGGELVVLGLDPVRSSGELRTRVGYVPDQPDHPLWLTPRELYRFLAPQYPRWNAGRAEELARDWEVPLDRPFKALSRGQAARAELAAALAQSPELLLLDECFAGLDPLARRDLLAGFLAVRAEQEITTLIVSHDLDVAARVADDVLVLRDGRTHAAGTLAEVLGDQGAPTRVTRRLLELLERPEAALGAREGRPDVEAEDEVAA